MLLPFNKINIVQNHFDEVNPLTSTAYNASLFDLVQKNEAILHLWTTTPAVALGHRDKQLPHLDVARTWLHSNNYASYIRSAGGLAVVSDTGILNVSLIFQQPDVPLSINGAYDLAVNLIQQALPELKISTNEIVGSYCPGSYDLSINHRKIAGLAQRRYRNKIAVSLYLSVSGDQETRGTLIRQMYQQGLQQTTITAPYPDVKPQTMMNLDAVSDISVPEFSQRLITAWQPFLPHEQLQLPTDFSINNQLEILEKRQPTT
ncbi:hypothetical protein EQG49_08180 [Periweissella cryptocerci]|uniref:BPL/LPL catalytic domain-containing protein n=1 Tax=Periweissella cryptocerci TaxID=2506420 RepID=A0A4P6YUS4_9LACO|nr:hypothetical protein [Periweissella cryptocerci]QBO36447.1 hypothetical protein EQG49_08180 [Periweissella cryptocerci]